VLSHTCSVVNQALRCNSPSVEDLTQCNTVRSKRSADWRVLFGSKLHNKQEHH
jgi:hypothetical protein